MEKKEENTNQHGLLSNQLKEDLLSLYNSDKVESASLLNKKLNLLNASLTAAYFSDNFAPMYFSGKIDADLVFVMLNPGAGADVKFSFRANNQFSDFNQYYNSYLDEHINYTKNKIDNFDLKQAAFLFDFKDSGIKIPDFFNVNSKEQKLIAQENVIRQKLQLELVPYFSAEFLKLFQNEKLAQIYFPIFENHINRVFDAIIEHKRKYIIFGAKQFYYLFKVMQKQENYKIELGTEKCFSIDGLQKRTFFNTVTITYKNKIINAGIAYSFPRRDLPNAFEKMRKYGELCYLEMKTQFG
jgi:hypothetical protein